MKEMVMKKVICINLYIKVTYTKKHFAYKIFQIRALLMTSINFWTSKRASLKIFHSHSSAIDYDGDGIPDEGGYYDYYDYGNDYYDKIMGQNFIWSLNWEHLN